MTAKPRRVSAAEEARCLLDESEARYRTLVAQLAPLSDQPWP